MSRGRILVVDDDDGVRSFVAEALGDVGHDIACAVDGEDARQQLARTSFHVLVTDLKMPRLDGMGLTRHVRAEHPEVEIVILTAFGTVGDAVEAMKLGAFDYLQKPIGSPAELRMVIERAVERYRLHALAERARGHRTAPVLSHGAPSMRPVIDALNKVARTDATVLLIGESGTGKEVAARTLHAGSPRADGPFVAINCAALSSTLLESELFGHEKGAFTGAHARRRGKLELAEGGTFFLDEVGELDPTLQAKLLRVLQERTFERVGGGQTIYADVRVIAATNRDLQVMIAEGSFREDLFHRLAVFPVVLPPLRERTEDIRPLAEHLLADSCARLGRGALRLSRDALAYLESAPWPGNVRELANALERAVILADGTSIQSTDLQPPTMGTAPMRQMARTSPIQSLADMEREAISAALQQFSGNRAKAAKVLGIGVRTLYDKIKRYGL